ncbi:MAG: hypothetical protein Ct9H300mP9_6550 [Candidatus Neomarinimicrobiota bacterium]|nr:MAG: hypothetical protein Ct9H300mP9_6550 [Candidatus Neomarinimicrobiota bacterium]
MDTVKLINILGFRAGWWSCVLGAQKGLPYMGPVVMGVFLIYHYFWGSRELKEFVLIIIFAVVGTLIDTGLPLSGAFTYQGGYAPDVVLAPLWITAMWCGFVATVNHSMPWLKGRPFLAAWPVRYLGHGPILQAKVLTLLFLIYLCFFSRVILAWLGNIHTSYNCEQV